ncbi:MAG: hypothetical protein A2V66_04130 [Ignavibacteria bacterium RBG_13_36_8]|nr:MAG: hypothetical protein A2V66_04130 [Ignavibacteria bacterium RBG_13_36_8]
MIKVFSTIFLLAAVIYVGYSFWPEAEVTQPPGVMASEEPFQKNISDGRGWVKDEYLITAIAEFKLRARVLSKENYHWDDESGISPTDLALGWGRMSDQSVVEQLDIWQSGRWYYWKTDNFPIPKSGIETYSANMHIIPANESVENILDEVVKGNIIELEGYLVKVSGPGGWKWASSMSRTDRGSGACEVVYVEKIKIIM